MTDPDMGTWTYTYDLNGNLHTQTDSAGVKLTFAYDELNRPTIKTYPDGSTAEFEYDAGADGIGYLYRKSNASAETVYGSFDPLGRVRTETRIVDTAIVDFEYYYDAAGRLAEKTFTRDNTLFKTLKFDFYPGTSLLKTVKKADNTAYTEITEYTPQGKIVFMNHSNNTVTNYIYDDATARISVIHAYNMTQDITDKAYTYSKAGDVTKIVNGRTAITYTYDYDHLHRLVSEQSSGDGAVSGTSVEEIEFTYAEADGQPIHAPISMLKNGYPTFYRYTPTGNRSLSFFAPILRPVAGYTTNDDNMISQIYTFGPIGTTHFFYDADSKRVQKTQGTDTTLYFGQDFEIINGTSVMYVFAGNLRVAKVTDDSLIYFHKDHLGSTNALSDEDGNIIDLHEDGDIIDSAESLPYGLDRKINDLLQSSAYKFTDQEQDDGTGPKLWDYNDSLYNYDARLYDPDIGQFIMADTIVPDPYNPQSLNRYSYCLNNPLGYIDPSGHDEEWLQWLQELWDGFFNWIDGCSTENNISTNYDDYNEADYPPGEVYILPDITVTAQREQAYASNNPVIRNTVNYLSIADILPIGVKSSILGATLDFAAAVGTVGVLTMDFGTGGIGFDQFSAGLILNTTNYFIGQAGNTVAFMSELTGHPLGNIVNVGLSGVEFGILSLQNKITTPKN